MNGLLERELPGGFTPRGLLRNFADGGLLRRCGRRGSGGMTGNRWLLGLV
jgi:hypothetical protein